MRILFLSDLLAYGGASKLICDLLPRMEKKGNDCELLILTDEHSKYIEELQNANVKVEVVPKDIKGHWKKIQYIKQKIEKGGYDIIHANLFPVMYYCSIVKRMLGKKCPPLIMTEHSTDNRRRHKFYLRGVERFVYSNYTHVVSISEKTQENLTSWLRAKGDERFSVIANGIDVGGFQNAEPLSKNHICNDHMEKDVLLLTVGSFTPQKNHIKLIEALKILPENFKLLLCGEGPLESEIRQRVIDLDLNARVFFLGFRKDIARIMHTADILVIPSIWEGFGLIAAEGMACGIPIAASDVPGLSEVIGDAGIKFNPQSSEEICEAIKKLITKEYRDPLIQKGHQRVTLYDINETVAGYLSLYERYYTLARHIVK